MRPSDHVNNIILGKVGNSSVNIVYYSLHCGCADFFHFYIKWFSNAQCRGKECSIQGNKLKRFLSCVQWIYRKYSHEAQRITRCTYTRPPSSKLMQASHKVKDDRIWAWVVKACWLKQDLCSWWSTAIGCSSIQDFKRKFRFYFELWRDI